MNMKGFNEPPETTNYESRFSLRYPLFHGGSILAQTRAKRAMWNAQKGMLEVKRQEVALRVIRAYIGLLLAQGEEKAAKKAVKTAEHHVEQAKNRYHAETALKADVLQAKVFLAKMKDRLAKAVKNRQVAALRLLLEMGEKIGSWYPEPNEDLEELYNRWSRVNLNVDELRQGAKERGDVKAVQMAALSASEMEKAAKGQYLPSIDLMASAQWNGHTAPFDSDASSWMIGGRLSFNIFDGFQRRHKVAQSKAARLEHEALLARKEKEALFQVESSLLAVTEAAQRVSAAKESVAQAEEALRVVEKRYNNGLATVVMLNDTQTALEDAKVLRLSAMHDYLVSVANLLFAGNKLLDFIKRGEAHVE
jgi:outer membrane protein